MTLIEITQWYVNINNEIIMIEYMNILILFDFASSSFLDWEEKNSFIKSFILVIFDW